MTEVKASKQKVEISNPEKIMFPDEELTKQDVAGYYRKISEYILPFLKGRPMVLHRYPNGINGQDFYQKDTPGYFPGWIKTIRVDVQAGGKGHENLVNCDSADTLLYLVNQACITPHVWLSTGKDLNRPDRMIFDLDPPGNDFDLVRKGAQDLKDILDKLDLTAFPMTTGSKGVHIVIPLDGKSDFDDVREFAAGVAHLLAETYPDRYTTETRKDKRKGRLFIDYLRNSYAQTAVAPYSLRARNGAPVATPLDWPEIGQRGITSASYTQDNIFRRLSSREDPWKDFRRHKAGLKQATGKLEDLRKKALDR